MSSRSGKLKMPWKNIKNMTGMRLICVLRARKKCKNWYT